MTTCILRRTGQQKLGTWLKNILQNGDRGGELRRDFVVCIISTCINCNINGEYFFTILKLLMDVNQIPVYNWRAYLLQCLNDTVVEWTQNHSRYFKGAPLFLITSEIVTNFLPNVIWWCCSFFRLLFWIIFFTKEDVFVHYNKLSCSVMFEMCIIRRCTNEHLSLLWIAKLIFQ